MARCGIEGHLDSMTAHECGQLVMNKLDHEFSWLYGCQHIHAESFFLYSVCKCLGDLIVDICIEQRTTYVL